MRNSFRLTKDNNKSKNLFDLELQTRDDYKSDISEIKPIINEVNSIKVLYSDYNNPTNDLIIEDNRMLTEEILNISVKNDKTPTKSLKERNKNILNTKLLYTKKNLNNLQLNLKKNENNGLVNSKPHVLKVEKDLKDISFTSNKSNLSSCRSNEVKINPKSTNNKSNRIEKKGI